MDNPVCVSCHKGLSLEDIERGNFKHLGGRLYCAECVAKMRRVGPIACPRCGITDTPLYTGKSYVCRKCGSELQPRAEAVSPTRAPAPRPKRPVKRCPYCGAVLDAEALKCRYCGSALTREARELATSSLQNSQLRFWLGCLLSASVFLLIFLVYAMTRKSETPRPQAVEPAAVSPAPAAPPTAEGSDEVVKELRDQLEAVRAELAAMKAARERAAAKKEATEALFPTHARLPKALTPPEVVSLPPKPKEEPAVAPKTPLPEPKAAPLPPPTPKPEATPAKAPEPAPKAVAPPPTPKNEEPAPAPKASDRTAAEVAAAAYPVFLTELDKLKAARRYGDAVSACRQFVAAHLGTPQAEQAQAAQTALRQELEGVRDERARRFREAMQKADLDAARKAVADLVRYDAPEVREDRDRMLAEIKATEEKPADDESKYLSQWKTPPNVARHLQELKTEADWTNRSRAARQLALLNDRAALGGLIQALRDPEWYVAISVLKALADLGDPIALPHLCPLTKDAFPGIYDHAAQACHTLAAASRDKYADAWKLVDAKAVAAELVEALKLQGKEDSAVTSRYQIALVDTLALLDAKEAAPAIRSLIDSNDYAVRKAVVAAVKKLTGETLDPGPPPEPPKPPPPPPQATKPAPPAPKPPEPKLPNPEASKPAPPIVAAPADESKPAPKAGGPPAPTVLRGEALPEPKPEPKPAPPPPPPKTETKPEAKPAPEAKPTPPPAPESVPLAVAAPEPAPKPEPKPVPEAKPTPPPPAAPKPEPKAEPKPEPVVPPKPEPKPAAAVPPKDEAKPVPPPAAPEPEPKVAAKPEQKPAPPPTESKPTPKPEPEPAPVPPPKPEPKPSNEPAPTALAGVIEQARDVNTISIGVRNDHGLKKGDRLDVLVGGSPVCAVQVVEAEPSRVVATLTKQEGKTAPAVGTSVSLRLIR